MLRAGRPPGGSKEGIFFHRQVQNASGAHPPSYLMGTGGLSHGGEAAGP